MHRFYLAPEEWRPDALELTGGEAQHCRNVLRLEPGDKVVIFDGRGRELTADISEMSGARVRLRKLHESSTPPLRCRITLAQAIPKGKNMDLIVQKAVEIGAAEIAPILSDRRSSASTTTMPRRSRPSGRRSRSKPPSNAARTGSPRCRRPAPS